MSTGKSIYRPFRNLAEGQRTRRLVLIRLIRDGVNRRLRFWLCQCDCGNQIEVRESLLAAGWKGSCGCLAADSRRETGRKRATHGASRNGKLTPEYIAWNNCRSRCYDPKNTHYKDYGGRGIKVCPEWRNSFSRFLADVGPRPSPKHSLDRFPDNDGNYEAGNVRWATQQQQQRNNRKTYYLTIDGVTRCIVEWEEVAGLSRGTIHYRMNAGWSKDQLLTPHDPLKIRSCRKGWETRRNAVELERPSVTDRL